jgi:ubiquinone/menaquinone biosynthesis C-methylase UbiE
MMNIRKFWDEYLTCYDGLNEVKEYSAYLDELASRAISRPGEKILDAGSGTGNLSLRLAERGAEVTGFDYSEVAVSSHRQKAPQMKVLQGSLEEPLPFANASFDVVVCASVLFTLSEHGVNMALSEFRRILKPNGRLLVTVAKPGHGKFRLAVRQLARQLVNGHKKNSIENQSRRGVRSILSMAYYNWKMYQFRKQGNYRQYSREALEGRVAKAGFSELHYSSVYGDLFHLIEAAKKDKAAAESLIDLFAPEMAPVC